MARLVKTDNPDGTATVKVAKGSKAKTSSGKTAKGGKIVGKLPRKKPQVEEFSLDVDDEELDSWDETADYDELLEEDTDDSTKEGEYIYVTSDGIVGDVSYDGLQIINTSGISEEGIIELADAYPDEREELAEQLRGSALYDSKHYFNNTGEYGPVRGLKLLNLKDLTKSELNRIYASDEPFSEADNYETQSYVILSPNAKDYDDMNNHMMLKNLSY